jgi:F0F1-type ATP synthase epsilon subunit
MLANDCCSISVDYGNWEKTLAQSQEETARKRAAGELDDEPERKRQPTKKEMAAIRERNKAKKEQKQKGWLLS